MGRGSVEQIGGAVASEIKGVMNDIEHIQDGNTDTTKEMERTMRRMEQHAKNAAKVVGAVTGGWSRSGGERSTTWDADVTV